MPRRHASLLALAACVPPSATQTTDTAPTTTTTTTTTATTTTTEADPTTTNTTGLPTTTTTTSSTTTSGTTSTSSTTTPLGGCDLAPPCRTCVCQDDAWKCHCPDLPPESGYIDLEPIEYELGKDDTVIPMTSSPARLFYSYHPADDDPGDAPLLLFFNGGPGVSTGLILAGNTAPQTLTDALDPAPSPAPWTAVGHLLYLDARNTGFSYQAIADPADFGLRSAELQTRNFNSYLDAADFARALLRFWDDHPDLANRRLVLVAESYGGIRASILLNMFLFPGDYGDGSARYRDLALVEDISDHLAARYPDADPVTPELVGADLGHLVLVQPSLAGSVQLALGGDMLEEPGSIVWQLAADLGLTFVPCADKPQPCDAWSNVINFVEGVGRSRYDIDGAGTWLSDLFARTRAGLSRRNTLAAILQVAPEDIDGLALDTRTPGAFRVRNPGDYLADAAAGDLPEWLGALAEWDRYYLPFSAEALDGFRGPVAIMTGVHSSDPHYGGLFLHDLAYARVFVTNAARDLAVWSPAIAPTLEVFYNQVTSAVPVADLPRGTARPGELHVQFKPGAFPGEPDPGLRAIRFPTYDASHAVTYDHPVALRDDVIEWLAEGP